MGATIPADRMAEPADVAQAVLWVASPSAAYMSGTNLLLQGGGEARLPGRSTTEATVLRVNPDEAPRSTVCRF